MLPTKGGISPVSWQLHSLPPPLLKCVSNRSTVTTPPQAFVLNADSQYHMAVAYYLKTFAVAEPFVVSMHRQLSVMHPIHKLLRSYSQVGALRRWKSCESNWWGVSGAGDELLRPFRDPLRFPALGLYPAPRAACTPLSLRVVLSFKGHFLSLVPNPNRPIRVVHRCTPVLVATLE